MPASFDRFDRWAISAVAVLDRYSLGNPVRIIAFLYGPIWALLLDSGVDPGRRWKIFFFVLFVLFLIAGALLERHRNTAALINLTTGLRRANGSFAGTLEAVTRKLSRRVGNRRTYLSEEECSRFAMSLLARARELSYAACGVGEDDIRLRATLSVPDPDGHPGDLRTWCYDRPYNDARYSRLRAGWPGAPMAFENRTVEIISDLTSLDHPSAKDRRFVSVISYPVRANHQEHPPLAIVNIDADKADFFDPERTERLTTYVQPIVQSIGLVIISRKHNDPFTFS